VTVGAIAAVNACGDVYDPHTGKLLACGKLPDGTPIPCESLLFGAMPAPELLKFQAPGQNTTLVVVATDAPLNKAQAGRLATCAHDGLARAIRPAHTQMDGDTVFALATGRAGGPVNFVQLCAAAAEVVARAICNGVQMGRFS
jgi:L-aminopeptidase/D-esterase-like protein